MCAAVRSLCVRFSISFLHDDAALVLLFALLAVVLAAVVAGCGVLQLVVAVVALRLNKVERLIRFGTTH